MVEGVGAFALGLCPHAGHEVADGREQGLERVHLGLSARRDALDDGSFGVEGVGEQGGRVGDLGVAQRARRGDELGEGTGDERVEGGDGGGDASGGIGFGPGGGGGGLGGRWSAGLRLEARGDRLETRHERLHVHRHDNVPPGRLGDAEKLG